MSSPKDETDLIGLRKSLLDFIAEFANWDHSTNKFFLETSRALTQSAHESLGGQPGTRPLVVDPFAGGGSIPLEALRVGADAFASDLNPVAVLLNKVVLEYIPKYGQRLADEVRKWGEWIKDEAEKELAEFYPTDPTARRPSPISGHGRFSAKARAAVPEVPLIRSLWLCQESQPLRRVAARAESQGQDGWTSQIIVKEFATAGYQADPKPKSRTEVDGNRENAGLRRVPAAVTQRPLTRVREQLKTRRGGSQDARLLSCRDDANECIRDGSIGCPCEIDLKAVQRASDELAR